MNQTHTAILHQVETAVHAPSSASPVRSSTSSLHSLGPTASSSPAIVPPIVEESHHETPSAVSSATNFSSIPTNPFATPSTTNHLDFGEFAGDYEHVEYSVVSDPTVSHPPPASAQHYPAHATAVDHPPVHGFAPTPAAAVDSYTDFEDIDTSARNYAPYDAQSEQQQQQSPQNPIATDAAIVSTDDLDDLVFGASAASEAIAAVVDAVGVAVDAHRHDDVGFGGFEQQQNQQQQQQELGMYQYDQHQQQQELGMYEYDHHQQAPEQSYQSYDYSQQEPYGYSQEQQQPPQQLQQQDTQPHDFAYSGEPQPHSELDAYQQFEQHEMQHEYGDFGFPASAETPATVANDFSTVSQNGSAIPESAPVPETHAQHPFAESAEYPLEPQHEHQHHQTELDAYQQFEQTTMQQEYGDFGFSNTEATPHDDFSSLIQNSSVPASTTVPAPADTSSHHQQDAHNPFGAPESHTHSSPFDAFAPTHSQQPQEFEFQQQQAAVVSPPPPPAHVSEPAAPVEQPAQDVHAENPFAQGPDSAAAVASENPFGEVSAAAAQDPFAGIPAPEAVPVGEGEAFPVGEGHGEVQQEYAQEEYAGPVAYDPQQYQGYDEQQQQYEYSQYPGYEGEQQQQYDASGYDYNAYYDQQQQRGTYQEQYAPETYQHQEYPPYSTEQAPEPLVSEQYPQQPQHHDPPTPVAVDAPPPPAVALPPPPPPPAAAVVPPPAATVPPPVVESHPAATFAPPPVAEFAAPPTAQEHYGQPPVSLDQPIVQEASTAYYDASAPQPVDGQQQEYAPEGYGEHQGYTEQQPAYREWDQQEQVYTHEQPAETGYANDQEYDWSQQQYGGEGYDAGMAVEGGAGEQGYYEERAGQYVGGEGEGGGYVLDSGYAVASGEQFEGYGDSAHVPAPDANIPTPEPVVPVADPVVALPTHIQCMSCSHLLDVGSLFCNKCGTRVSVVAPQPPAAEEAPAPPQIPVTNTFAPPPPAAASHMTPPTSASTMIPPPPANFKAPPPPPPTAASLPPPPPTGTQTLTGKAPTPRGITRTPRGRSHQGSMNESIPFNNAQQPQAFQQQQQPPPQPLQQQQQPYTTTTMNTMMSPQQHAQQFQQQQGYGAMEPAAAAPRVPFKDPLGRDRGHAIGTFSFGGKLVVTYPLRTKRAVMNGGATVMVEKSCAGYVKITGVQELVKGLDMSESHHAPILGARSKLKKKDVVRVAEEGVRRVEGMVERGEVGEDVKILWGLVKMFVEGDGVLLSGKPEVSAAIRDLLLKSMPAQNVTTALGSIQALLLKGDKVNACKAAADAQLWTHGSLISTQIDPDTYRDVINSFIRCGFGSIDAAHPVDETDRPGLRVLYALFAGSKKDAVGMYLTNPADHEASFVSLGLWKEAVALIVANRTPGDVVAISALGDLLASYGMTVPAHICFLLSNAHSLISGADAPNVKAVLLGADHLYNYTRFSKDFEALRLTELFEFSQSLLNNIGLSGGLAHLQAYKLVYAHYLADLGLIPQSIQYCDSIEQVVKNYGKGAGSPYFGPPFATGLGDLIEHLSMVNYAAQDKEDPVSGGSGATILGKLNPKRTLSNFSIMSMVDKVMSSAVGEDISGQAPSSVASAAAAAAGQVKVGGEKKTEFFLPPDMIRPLSNVGIVSSQVNGYDGVGGGGDVGGYEQGYVNGYDNGGGFVDPNAYGNDQGMMGQQQGVYENAGVNEGQYGYGDGYGYQYGEQDVNAQMQYDSNGQYGDQQGVVGDNVYGGYGDEQYAGVGDGQQGGVGDGYYGDEQYAGGVVGDGQGGVADNGYGAYDNQQYADGAGEYQYGAVGENQQPGEGQYAGEEMYAGDNQPTEVNQYAGDVDSGNQYAAEGYATGQDGADQYGGSYDNGQYGTLAGDQGYSNDGYGQYGAEDGYASYGDAPQNDGYGYAAAPAEDTPEAHGEEYAAEEPMEVAHAPVVPPPAVAEQLPPRPTQAAARRASLPPPPPPAVAAASSGVSSRSSLPPPPPPAAAAVPPPPAASSAAPPPPRAVSNLVPPPHVSATQSAPMATARFSEPTRPTSKLSQELDDDNGFGNSSLSGKDRITESPMGNTGDEPAKAESEKPVVAKEEKRTSSSWFAFPSIFGGGSKAGNDKDKDKTVYVAKMGESMQMSYDPVQKKWVNKSGEAVAATAVVKPPPMATTQSAPASRLTTPTPADQFPRPASGLAHATSPTDASTPVSGQVGVALGGGRRRGARNKYVDVMKPNGTKAPAAVPSFKSFLPAAGAQIVSEGALGEPTVFDDPPVAADATSPSEQVTHANPITPIQQQLPPSLPSAIPAARPLTATAGAPQRGAGAPQPQHQARPVQQQPPPPQQQQRRPSLQKPTAAFGAAAVPAPMPQQYKPMGAAPQQKPTAGFGAAGVPAPTPQQQFKPMGAAPQQQQQQRAMPPTNNNRTTPPVGFVPRGAAPPARPGMASQGARRPIRPVGNAAPSDI
ncbi:vesicle coat component [Podochytrium sp. JEL0797]|nr:vesicle coat component [Podochytrium sp. JEL0797]